MEKITEGVRVLKVDKERRGSDMPAAEIQKSRRRLSVMGSGVSHDKAHYLDGAQTPEVQEEAKKNRKASVKPDFGGEKCYKLFAKLSNVGFVPFNNNKVNQDRPLVVDSFLDDKSKALFGVFDGHGALGHEVSQFVIDNLPQICAADHEIESDPPAALTRSFETFNKKLASSIIDCTFSGTTAVMAYINGTTIHCANAGDSRCVLASIKDGKLVAKDLSNDQKPENEEEAAHIIKSGGRVAACKGYGGEDVGPKRVWLKNQDVPGLAMTRSFGDLVAASVGVRATPEVITHELTSDDKFMIICSDGVWEFITSQEAVDFVGKYSPQQAQKACEELFKESTRRWKEEEDVVDDTTVVLVYF